MFINVDLPEPDGPMIATNSPGADRQVDTVERAHFGLALAVGAADCAQFDQWRGHVSSPWSVRG